MLMNEIQAVLQPEDKYCVLHTATQTWYKMEDYDLSICQPRPNAKGKRLTRKGHAQIYRIGGCDVYF